MSTDKVKGKRFSSVKNFKIVHYSRLSVALESVVFKPTSYRLKPGLELSIGNRNR